jgi:hypothetical protein
LLHRSFFSIALSLVAVSALVHAQSPSPQEPEYTFHGGTRIVLTDVTLTDRKGNPVHGFKASETIKGREQSRPFFLSSVPARNDGWPISRSFFARCGDTRTLIFFGESATDA